MAEDLERLEAKRKDLYQELSQVGDFRRGSIIESSHRCGKPNCACALPDHPGHGPQYRLTTKVAGKTHALNLKPGPQLRKVEQEVANHRRFHQLSQQIIEVNEEICNAKPITPEAEAEATAKKGASKLASSPRQSPLTDSKRN